MTTHIATIGTATDVVLGDTCDLTVYRAKTEISAYLGSDEETTEYVADGDATFTSDLTVLLDDEDRDVKAMAEADDILTARGYTRTSDWGFGGNAMYAEVEAADEDLVRELTIVAAEIDTKMARRDLLVQSLMDTPVARKRIAEAAKLSEPRLYQIRDGRR